MIRILETTPNPEMSVGLMATPAIPVINVAVIYIIKLIRSGTVVTAPGMPSLIIKKAHAG